MGKLNGLVNFFNRGKKIGAICLEGSTIVESLIAMIVVVTCISIAFMSLSNLISTNKIRLSTSAQLEGLKILQETKKEKTFINETLQKMDFRIEKEVVNYQGNKNLVYIKIRVLKKENELAKLKEIIKL
ncbi:MAG TPA: hypothetical protein PKN75_12590 [Bacteroidia bacterium]|nr:hypothetical protein [Bacteroidia bacterium]HNU34416.1 hypothetical protein [Bacteroidia bacterium]